MKHNMEALAQLLSATRGDTPRARVVARSGISSSHLKRLEQASLSDVGIGTLLQVANGYDLHILDVVVACLGVSQLEREAWSNQYSSGTTTETVLVQTKLPLALTTTLAEIQSATQDIDRRLAGGIVPKDSLDPILGELQAVLVALQRRLDVPFSSLTRLADHLADASTAPDISQDPPNDDAESASTPVSEQPPGS